MERAFARHVRQGALEIATETDSLTGSLTFTVRGALGGSAFGFYTRVRRYLRTILEVTLASINFKVEAIPESEVKHLNRLLKYFPLHCDRFYVDIADSLKKTVRIDAVKVNIVLHPRPPGIASASLLALDGDPGTERVTSPLRLWHKDAPATRAEVAP